MSFFVFSAVTLMLIGGFFVVLTSHFLRDRIAEEIFCTGEVMATVIEILLVIGIALIIAGIAVFVVGMAVYSKLPEI